MKNGTITGTVTTPVVLGQGNYGATLTIATTGSVYPAVPYAAITGPSGLAGVVLNNMGLVTGGYGGYDAILLREGGKVTNSGTVAGSKGDYGGTNGGVGVYLASGLVSNSGLIAGGMGGDSDGIGPGASGGSGIDLKGAGRISNTGTVVGGSGGYGNNGYPGGAYGFGIYLEGNDVLVNGSGGVIAGLDGVCVSGTAHVSNAGTISSKYAGVGVFFRNAGELTNSGLIGGTYGIISRGAANVTNVGTICGGAGSGVGIILSADATLTNAGTIVGGNGAYSQYAYSGGLAVAIGGNSIGTNQGIIQGGAGYIAHPNFGLPAGTGGTGIYVFSACQFTNSGTIAGGSGGNGTSASGYYAAGVGGVGVQLVAAPTLFGGAGEPVFANTGVIGGGAGGIGPGHSGAVGGVGVVIDGGTLLAEAGIIAGGVGGNGAVRGDAVAFGKVAGTLVVSPGASFVGDIVANAQVADTLDLVGKSAGTLSGLGTTVTGFTTISEESGATWRLDGTLTGVGSVVIDTNATLQFYGAATTTRIAFGPAGHATLLLGNPSQIGSTFAGFGTGDKIELAGVAATSLSYAGGTLTLLDAGGHVVDTLHFSGSYTQADFALQSFAQGTAVVYAGSAAETLSGHFGGTAFGGFLLHHGVAVS